MDNLQTLKELKDITNIVQIPDNSLWYLLATIIFTISVIAIMSYYLYKKNMRNNFARKNALRILQHLDFQNSKEVAYLFTKYSVIIANNENTQNIQDIINQLQKYKYKKSVESLDAGVVLKIKEVVGV